MYFSHSRWFPAVSVAVMMANSPSPPISRAASCAPLAASVGARGPGAGRMPAMTEEVSTEVTIYTDGACKGNPGPGGWGAWLKSGEHEKELWGGEALTTNNRMELTAVIKGLSVLTRRCTVAIYTDSEYVRNGIMTWIHGWKKRGWKTADGKPVKNVELWQQLEGLANAHDVQWHWVKGHAGDPGNERADMLANKGVQTVLDGTATP